MPGTTIVEDRPITVRNNDATPPNPNAVAFQTAAITKPVNGSQASFSGKVTQVEGTTSAETDAIELYYTKVAAKDTPTTAQWIKCALLDLDGLSTSPQTFNTPCTLVGADQPSQVRGIAVVAFDCVAEPDCDASPTTSPQPPAPAPPRQARAASGDAVRIFGYEAVPVLTLEPVELQAPAGECKKFTLSVGDQTGQPLGARNVDVHVTGPSDEAAFCQPADGSATPNRPPDQGSHQVGVHTSEGPDTQHVEGETNPAGRFIFGLTSSTQGDQTIQAWIDQTENDLLDAGEVTDAGLVHWVNQSGCTIVGTGAAETIEGTDGDDTICGKGGNDTIDGLGGNDTVKGGKGADELSGGGGDDLVLGGLGPDRIFGNEGDDNLTGGKKNDVINGGPGIDECFGSAGKKDKFSNCESSTADRRAFGSGPARVYF